MKTGKKKKNETRNNIFVALYISAEGFQRTARSEMNLYLRHAYYKLQHLLFWIIL